MPFGNTKPCVLHPCTRLWPEHLGGVLFVPGMRAVCARLHYVAFCAFDCISASSVRIFRCCILIWLHFFCLFMHFTYVAFTNIVAFECIFWECIHAAFDVLHYIALCCIQFWLHSEVVAFFCIHAAFSLCCILTLLHSHFVAFWSCCIRPPVAFWCIPTLLHFENVAFSCILVHSKHDAFETCITAHVAFLTCCIILHSNTLHTSCILDMLHSDAFDCMRWHAAFWASVAFGTR